MMSNVQPVAWIIETEIEGKLNTWVSMDKKHHRDSCDIGEPIPLYLQPTHKPLTGADIAHGFRSNEDATDPESYWAGVEYAEKQHGIRDITNETN
jgi:hypothetical protein